jgi:hypothetical protein
VRSAFVVWRRSALVMVAVALVGGSGAVMAPAVAAAGGPSAVTAVTGGPEQLPVGSRAVGALPGTSALSVDVALRPADPAALQTFAQEVADPASPLFRHFLAPGQFAGRFGPAPSVIASTRAWLGSEGLEVGPTAGDGLLIPVSGSADQLGAAFGVGFEQEQLPTGRIVREPTARPAVPRALAGSVQGVVGLDDLAIERPHLARPATAAPAEGPEDSGPVGHAGPSACGAANSAGATANELAQAYSISSLQPANEGQGVTVGIYELEPYLPSDISTFESCYSPAPSPTITPVSVDGAAPNAGAGGGEAALDIQMVVGLAPKANIDVYVGHNFGIGPLDVYAQMVDQDQAQVLTTSWGQCESAAGTADIETEATLLQQAATQGQSVVAASGDSGSEDCNAPGIFNDTQLEVDDPASQPWVTAVGGTELDSLGPPPGESVWNTGVFEGTTGGGNSRLWTMPSWQLGPGVESGYTRANDSYTGASPCPLNAGGGAVSCREVPDVAADGDPNTGFATFCSCGPNPGHFQAIGGTSMSAPLFASIAALADENGVTPRRLGQLDPSLYQAGCSNPRPFNDVTSGNNQPLGSAPSNAPRTPGGPYYPATSGYDMASGLGTPIASSLLPDLITPVNACPAVSGMSVRSGPAAGGTVVTLSGSNLSGVGEVDFGPNHAGSVLATSASSVTVATPGSPTGGWNTALVVVKTANDAIGADGRNYFTFTGPRGYWTTASDGGVFTFGQVGYHGSTGGIRLQKPVVGIAPTPSSKGYWLVASDGGVFSFGDAGFHGSTGGIRLTRPIVGMASTPDGQGYWLVASDGGVFAFGDAGFFGSTGGIALQAPIVGMAVTPDGGGYWLVASDGGIFAFGDAGFFGSTGGIRLAKPIVGMATTPNGQGYWLAASDGGIFTFGNAGFAGSLGGIRLTRPIVGISTPFGGGGYWLVASDGGIFAFGGAGFAGSMGGHPLNAPMVGMGGS